ncbi:hypothetical protein TNCV_1052791 [Trichonephila clavipes]|nr:hypothetical protein TNCV_1052791 [Trichonephila clavipes]
MIPACNKKRCAAFPFETGIHSSDFFPEEDTTKSYSGFEPTRLQTEGHSHHTGWATLLHFEDIYSRLKNFEFWILWFDLLLDTIYFQCVPSYIGLKSNEIADSLAKYATADTLRGIACLTVLELSSIKRLELNALWRITPAYPRYFGKISRWCVSPT